jgi:hypothetical protein
MRLQKKKKKTHGGRIDGRLKCFACLFFTSFLCLFVHLASFCSFHFSFSLFWTDWCFHCTKALLTDRCKFCNFFFVLESSMLLANQRWKSTIPKNKKFLPPTTSFGLLWSLTLTPLFEALFFVLVCATWKAAPHDPLLSQLSHTNTHTHNSHDPPPHSTLRSILFSLCSSTQRSFSKTTTQLTDAKHTQSGHTVFLSSPSSRSFLSQPSHTNKPA